MSKLFCFVPILFVFNMSHACIWQNSAQPYWETKEIPVCFVKLQSGQNYFEWNRARVTVINAYVRQLNRRTAFEFSGFGTCEDDKNKSQAIRISLTSGTGGGRAVGIGPSVSRETPNLYIDSITEDPATGVRFFNPIETTNTVLHETMHLLGFFHDSDRNDSKRMNAYLSQKAIVLDGFDSHSVLVDPRAALLSKGDIKCLNLVANKKITEVETIPVRGKASEVESLSLDLPEGR